MSTDSTFTKDDASESKQSLNASDDASAQEADNEMPQSSQQWPEEEDEKYEDDEEERERSNSSKKITNLRRETEILREENRMAREEIEKEMADLDDQMGLMSSSREKLTQIQEVQRNINKLKEQSDGLQNELDSSAKKKLNRFKIESTVSDIKNVSKKKSKYDDHTNNINAGYESSGYDHSEDASIDRLRQRQIDAYERAKKKMRKKGIKNNNPVLTAMEEEHDRSMKRLQRKFERNKKKRKEYVQRYQHGKGGMSIREQVLRQKKARADARCKLLATMVKMEHDQNELLGNINSQKGHSSKLAETAFAGGKWRPNDDDYYDEPVQGIFEKYTHNLKAYRKGRMTNGYNDSIIIDEADFPDLDEEFPDFDTWLANKNRESELYD